MAEVGLAEAVAALQAELARAAAGTETGFQFPVTGVQLDLMLWWTGLPRAAAGWGFSGGTGWRRQLRSGRDPDSDRDTGGAGRSDREPGQDHPRP